MQIYAEFVYKSVYTISPLGLSIYSSIHFQPNEVQKTSFKFILNYVVIFFICDFTIDWRMCNPGSWLEFNPISFIFSRFAIFKTSWIKWGGKMTDESLISNLFLGLWYVPYLSYRHWKKNSEIHNTFSEFSRHREKNAELEKTLATQREKEDEAEKTLAEFKTKMEETSKRMFDDAKIQVLKYFVWNYISYLQLNRVECLLGASPGVDPGRFS